MIDINYYIINELYISEFLTSLSVINLRLHRRTPSECFEFAVVELNTGVDTWGTTTHGGLLVLTISELGARRPS